MHPYTSTTTRLCPYDLSPALLQKQQIKSFLQQGLRRGILFRREHLHLSHDLGIEVAAEKPASVS